ncbi:MAG: rRNA biogenesis protein, partial [Methanosarcinales archaeon]
IQLLGSEKALFRYLHGRGKSPKYGILFSHPLIQNSPQKHRGRIARTLASKLSIAAKMDFYSKEYKGDKLKK